MKHYHRVSRTVAAFALAISVVGVAGIAGCTSPSTNANNTNTASMNVSDKLASNTTTVSTEGTAAELSKSAVLKGDVLGAQHIKMGNNDFLMTSLMLEPNIENGQDTDAKNSKWTATLYFIAKDAQGNYVGSWAPEAISFDWTFSDRIDDNQWHKQAGQAPDYDLSGAKSLEVYVVSTKAVFSDGSEASWVAQDGLQLDYNNQAEATSIAQKGILIGSTTLETSTSGPGSV